MQVGLIGLGLMGSALASRLISAGHTVLGFDVVEDRRREHTGRGGILAASPAEVAGSCGLVILSLPNSDIVRSACLGPSGIAEGAKAGLLIVDTTTGRPGDTIELAGALAQRGIRFVDATLSGNSKMALEGKAVAMVGGPPDDVAEAWPILEVISRSAHHLGPTGAGAVTKLIVNLVLGINRAALGEGLVVGEKAGLDLEALMTVLRDGSSYSRAMDIYGDSMLTGTHYPPAARVRQTHKDFKLILELCQGVGAPAWLSSVVQQLLQVGEFTGLADADNGSIIETMRRQAGIGRVAG